MVGRPWVGQLVWFKSTLFEAKSCMNTPKFLIPWRQCRALGINGRLLGDRAT